MAEGTERRAPGRPRSAPEGRGGTLTITINPHTRSALEEAAAKLGRSLSQTAEYAIERGRMIGDLGPAGPGVADALQAMLKTALDVHREVGDPSARISARNELRARWGEIAKTALPNVVEPAPAEHAALAAITSMCFAADAAEAELRADMPDIVLARDIVRGIAAKQIYPGSPTWDESRRILEAVSEAEGGEVGDAIRDVLDVASVAERLAARAERGSHERS